MVIVFATDLEIAFCSCFDQYFKKSTFIVMETIELAYDVYESATDPDKNPIILIHGLFWNKFMFRDIAESLSQATKRKVFCLDLRCHDESAFCENWNADIMAEDVKRFMNDKQLEKVAFVCHSFSSTVAYLVTLDTPERVEKIVMIDHPPFAQFSPEKYEKNVVHQFAAQDRFLRTLDPSLSLSEAKSKILSICEGAVTEAQKVFLRKCAYELIKENNRFKFRTNQKALIDGFIQNCVTPPRGRSDHEILIIRCPDSSRISDEQFKAVQKYNPNAKLITLDGTSHLLMFEKQAEFVNLVKEFLS